MQLASIMAQTKVGGKDSSITFSHHFYNSISSFLRSYNRPQEFWHVNFYYTDLIT